jgi:hypothetical protein
VEHAIVDEHGGADFEVGGQAGVVGGGGNDSTRKDAFKVTSNNTIVVATQPSAPAYTGVEGEMVPVVNGGNYYIYVYIGGAWRSSSLA